MTYRKPLLRSLSRETKLGAAIGLTLVAIAIAISLYDPPAPGDSLHGQPPMSSRESELWTNTPCDFCGRSLTTSPADGLYTIQGRDYLAHGGCAARHSDQTRR